PVVQPPLLATAPAAAAAATTTGHCRTCSLVSHYGATVASTSDQTAREEEAE
ncbi:hypothetical protein GGF44_006579, partial [Coemansia sp. RSA 1694]